MSDPTPSPHWRQVTLLAQIALDIRKQGDPLNSIYCTTDQQYADLKALREGGLIHSAQPVSFQGGDVFCFVTITKAGRQMLS